MKSELRMILTITVVIVGIIYGLLKLDNKVEAKETTTLSKSIENNNEIASANIAIVEEIMTNQTELIEQNSRVEVYENMTIEELGEKLERSMEYELDGSGQTFAKYAIEMNVDPYLALSIVLHETGCTWGCSYLARECNNIGGQKGSYDGKSCGSYKYFPTLDDGIRGFIENLSINYFQKGITTAEAINRSYAESTTWSGKINTYIEKIRAN